MTEQALVEYIKRNVARGADVDEVKEKLKAEGWNESDIDDAISAASIQFQTSRKASGKLWLGIIVLTITIGVLIMAAVWFFIFGAVPISPNTDCESKGDNVYRALCYTDLARETDDITVCNNLRNTEERQFHDICIREFAVGKLDIDTCSGIDSSAIRDQCVERIKEKAGTA